MASLELDPDSGRYKVRFRLYGAPYKRSLKTRDCKEARSVVERINETIRLIERGRLDMPTDADPVVFVMSDGKHTSKVVAPKIRTLGSLFDAYRMNLPVGSKEESTLEAEDRHIKHLKRHLKTNCIAQSLSFSQMQEYVRKRSNDKWRDKPIGPDTIRKELTTFRFIWNWGVRHGHLIGAAPIKGISLPKTDEKPPFMAWDEISKAILRGNVSKEQQKQLWDCLFLRTNEIDRLLQYVETAALHRFIYPIFVIVAHTGARRSEILRTEIDDFDFQSRTIRLREKKKSRKMAITFRRVPMTDLLIEVMTDWIKTQPDTRLVFPCSVLPQANGATNSHKPLTGCQATDHFKQTLKGSDWETVRGFHVFRHSFASNCAAAGLDQRIIDEWMGHQTEEMRHRYRHLFPEQQRTAIESVFSRNGK